MSDLPLTITEAAVALRNGQLSSVELTQAVFERADRLDPKLGVYLQRMDASALDEARQADADLANGVDRGPLQGIPLGIKDIIATDNASTTAQSLILDPTWGDQGDAPVVARLRAAGAVITGKTTTMEFATGLPDADKPFPIPRNPWNADHWPGGSSSGTGAGVAAGLFLGGLGTDTGGSIRGPASYLRDLRAEADVRPRPEVRVRAAWVQSGPHRTYGPQRARLRGDVAGARRLRRHRSDVPQGTSA